MLDPVRQEVIALAHTVVVKVGTNVLAGPDGQLDAGRLQALADQVQRLREQGRKVASVSSGAIGAGVGRLGLDKRPSDLRHLQACAAVGQGFLMRAYEECLARHGTHTAQILLTAGDFDNRTRYLNARNTILTLFEWNVLPIINENDTVSVAEIRFGDNDHLAAMVTDAGESVLIANGTQPDILERIFAAEPVGTLFLPHGNTVPAWKRWLGYTAQPKGQLLVDAGARQAVQHKGRSLLPIGVTAVAGSFGKGDVVALVDPSGLEFARGLTNYSAD